MFTSFIFNYILEIAVFLIFQPRIYISQSIFYPNMFQLIINLIVLQKVSQKMKHIFGIRFCGIFSLESAIGNQYNVGSKLKNCRFYSPFRSILSNLFNYHHYFRLIMELVFDYCDNFQKTLPASFFTISNLSSRCSLIPPALCT